MKLNYDQLILEFEEMGNKIKNLATEKVLHERYYQGYRDCLLDVIKKLKREQASD